MDYESVVYGCIKDSLYTSDSDEVEEHRSNNRTVLATLPSVEDWPLLSREMFSMPLQGLELDNVQTDVMHFGSSYKAVEHEWEAWIKKFEAMLKKMYWVSATVHLETELNGSHTFNWEPGNSFHEPGIEGMTMRCEWTRDGSAF